MPKVAIDLKSGSIDKTSTVIGIDLGTTNSLIASIRGEKRLPYCLSTDGDSIIPSAIHFTDGDILVGKEAIARMVQEPQNTIYSVKRLMGKSFADLNDHIHKFNYSIQDAGDDNLVKIKIKGKQYSPIELSSLVLKKLKQTAELKLDEEINKVVITVPAYFNDSQRQATRDAGKLAGLDVLRIINEPTAASLAYGLGLDQAETKTVAVYDLGGGTFDISILRIQQGIFEVLATNGDTFLGGDDIDRSIVDFWIDKFNLKDLNDSENQWFRLKAEQAKKWLSETDLFEEKNEFRTSTIHLSLSLEQLNELVSPLLSKTMNCCIEALKDAETDLSEVNEVVLVGGSVRLKQLRKEVSNFFKNAHINDQHNPDEVVALGAAIEADILAGNRRDILLLDVTPLSLGMETLGGLMDVILPRNSKVPNKATRQYTTSVDGQVNLKVNVFQGERELVSDNRKLGEFELRGIPAMPAGLPKIEVAFMLDADGILKVSATELRSGVRQEVALTPQYGLTELEIESMLKESILSAEEDMSKRSIIESITEAKQLVYSMEKFMVDNADIMNKEDIAEIKQRLIKINEAIDAEDKDLIVNKCEELNAFSEKYAEQAMNRSIAKALKGKKV